MNLGLSWKHQELPINWARRHWRHLGVLRSKYSIFFAFLTFNVFVLCVSISPLSIANHHRPSLFNNSSSSLSCQCQVTLSLSLSVLIVWYFGLVFYRNFNQLFQCFLLTSRLVKAIFSVPTPTPTPELCSLYICKFGEMIRVFSVKVVLSLNFSLLSLYICKFGDFFFFLFFW